MRAPLTFAWGNVVFARDIDDAWALYRLDLQSYAGLTANGKHETLERLAGFAYGIEADFQLLRVTSPWSSGAYAASANAGADPEHAHVAALTDYLTRHEQVLGDDAPLRPAVFVAVRLPRRRPEHDDAPWPRVARALGLRDARGITRRRLDELLGLEARTLARVEDHLPCDRASAHELQWLVSRGFARGGTEPQLDTAYTPQALVIDAPAEHGGGRFVPLEVDLLRLSNAAITVGARALTIETEAGVSHQALLALGALPEVVAFPGRQAELLFAPLEALDFPVDACFNACWIANDEALALARRRLIDADHAYVEESHGDHGPTTSGAERPAAARELEDHLNSTGRPPLLRASITFAVGATTEDELQERVDRLRREYAPITLHRPFGAQLDLFLGHLPAQRPRVRDYDDVLTCEQFGAMVPTATHAVGSASGMYLGHTLSGSRQPVLFDLTEASRTSRAPAVLCSGTLGSGKTVAAQLLAYQGFLAGSRIVAVDPKGDHHLADLVGAEHVETIELRADRGDRGLLDPLRIGPEQTRADLAYGFLVDVLPAPVPAQWQTEIRRAVDRVAIAGGRSCADVLEALDEADEHGRDAARAIAVHTGSGLLQLGFADPATPLPEPTDRQVHVLRIANLTLPLPGTARSEMTHDERAGQALLRLLATHALHLMGGDWSRHKVLLFDEAWMLLGDAAGRAFVQRINRLCRSQNATPILATQVLADVAELEDLIGAYLCFGVETDAEAARALQLLHLDADAGALQAQLRAFRRGRCFMRDYDGRVGAIQVDPVDPALLDALDTTPRHHDALPR
jgi:hypothetical protein